MIIKNAHMMMNLPGGQDSCVMNAVVDCFCRRPMQRQTSSNPTKQLLQWAQHKTRFYEVSARVLEWLCKVVVHFQLGVAVHGGGVFCRPQRHLSFPHTSFGCTLQNVNVTDFTHSFKDGLALAAIMHCYMPEWVPFEELSADDPRRNFELAFAAAK